MENDLSNVNLPSQVRAYCDVLAALSSHVDRPICLLDANQHLLWTNTAWGQARGRISAAGISDWVDIDLVPGVHSVSFGRTHLRGELEITALTGEHPTYWLMVFSAIDQKLAAHDSSPAQTLLLQKREMLGGLAPALTLDFSQLLSAILGNADLLADDLSLAAHHKNPLQNIIAAAEMASELCQQVMSIAGGEDYPRFSTVDLGDVVRQLNHILQVASPERVSIEFEITDRTAVLGDLGRIQQLVLNLVLNSIQEIGASGTITVGVGTETLDTAARRTSLFADVGIGEYACITVSDTGPGIGPVVPKLIFDPTYSTHNESRGLGLAVVGEIVEWHRGTIVVDSSDQGAEFKIYLPKKIQNS
ncbi:MAG: ATP-binding protein [Pseudomonadota bacterium]